MNRTMNLAGIALLTLGMSASAHAIQLFKLSDHPDGALSPHDYGLRFDHAITHHTNFSFSVVTDEGSPEMFASVNGSEDEIRIFGKASYNNHLYDIDFTYNTNVTAVSNGWVVTPGGATSTENHGTITGPGLNGLAFFDKQNSSQVSFRLLANGHRLSGDNSTWVGWGWVTTRSDHGTTPGTHDWLFIATPTDDVPDVPGGGIPEPATAALSLLGMSALTTLATRRRRTR